MKCLINSKKVESVIATRRNLDALIPLADIEANISDNNKIAAREADVVFLCVKPNDIHNVLNEIKQEVNGKLVISTAAVVSLESLESVEPSARYVRTMPNIAAMVGESFTAYAMGKSAHLEDK